MDLTCRFQLPVGVSHPENQFMIPVLKLCILEQLRLSSTRVPASVHDPQWDKTFIYSAAVNKTHNKSSCFSSKCQKCFSPACSDLRRCSFRPDSGADGGSAPRVPWLICWSLGSAQRHWNPILFTACSFFFFLFFLFLSPGTELAERIY